MTSRRLRKLRRETSLIGILRKLQAQPSYRPPVLDLRPLYYEDRWTMMPDAARWTPPA